MNEAITKIKFKIYLFIMLVYVINITAVYYSTL